MRFCGRHYVPVLAGLIGIGIVAVGALRLSHPRAALAESGAPQYTADGKLLLPRDYREWIYLSSGLGMEYNAASKQDSEFTNVFVKPSAYRAFLRTGVWPDKTVFVLEQRASAVKGSVNGRGHYQTGLDGVAVSVKDEERFQERWAYFSFGKSAQARRPNPRSSCFNCHIAHGAVDNTFVQFYPTLKPVAQKYRTYSETKAAAE